MDELVDQQSLTSDGFFEWDEHGALPLDKVTVGTEALRVASLHL